MHLATLHDHTFTNSSDDIRGAVLYGEKNEKLGTIHDVVYDHGTGDIRYAVIDTGGWLSHKYFLVPSNRIQPYHKNENDFYADLSKERIELFPKYDPDAVKDETKWKDYESRYEKAWTDDGGILHAKGSPRIITPEPDQVAGAGTSTGTANIGNADIWPERIESPTKLPGGPTTMMHPDEQTATSAAVAPTSSQNQDLRRTTTDTNESAKTTAGESNRSPRWNSFQSTLNRDLPNLRKGCTSCGSKAGSDLGPTGYDEDAERKAS